MSTLRRHCSIDMAPSPMISDGDKGERAAHVGTPVVTVMTWNTVSIASAQRGTSSDAATPRPRVVRLAVLVAVAFTSVFALRGLGIEAREADTFAVQRVVDGDTVILETIGRVRLIGVDTPESVHPRKPV